MHVTVTDLQLVINSSGAIDHYIPDVVTITDYYAFGMAMPDKQWSTGDGYRFGFNGQGKDDEVSEAGNSYTAEYWQYDARLGRRWNVDPVVKKWENPYTCFLNNPVYIVDNKGDNSAPVKDANGNSTGQINARFVFINNGVANENDVADYVSYFMDNLNSNFNGSRTFTNEAGINVPIVGNFTYELFNPNYNDPDVNFIIVDPDVGQRSLAAQSGNSANMNVTDAARGTNAAAHEVLHYLGCRIDIISTRQLKRIH